MISEQPQLTSQKKFSIFTILAVITGMGAIISIAILILFDNKFSGYFIIPLLLITTLFIGIGRKRGEPLSHKFDILRPMTGFDQRMDLIKSFRWWPLSLVIGLGLATLFYIYNWPARGGKDLILRVLYWVMVVTVALGVLTPIAKFITSPHRVDRPGGFSFKRFIKLLLIGLIILVLIFICLGVWSYYQSHI